MGQYTIKDVQNRAELLKGDIDNIYRALNDKLGSSPETLDQVPEYILSIPDLPTEEPLTITPTIDGQEISAFDDLKYNPITVEPVTSAIDSNIQPVNIKEGVSILGVAGTLKEEKPEESFNVQPTTAEQTITPTAGSVFSGGTVRAVTKEIDANIASNNIKEGVTILGVAGTLKEEKPEERFNVQPTTAEQTITPTAGFVFSGGTVRAVTSAIDSNIVAGNIKEGVTILGVGGTHKGEKPEEQFNVQPTTTDQTITPTQGSVFSGGTVKAVTAEIDANIASNNIKEGVTILGVAGTLKEEKPEERFNVQPSTAEQTITPTAGSVFSGGTVHAVTSSIDSNIAPENIKEGVSSLGVAGTLSEGITPAGTIAINLNGTYDVTNYASAEVNVGDTPDYRYKKGTVDRAGLKAIGWTDEDILTFEQNKAPHYTWQNDQYKVSDENKALYLLDDPKPSSYDDNPNITFVPKKNMESYFAKAFGFQNMKYIKGIPFFDTSSATNLSYLFQNCSSLTAVPSIDTSKATNVVGQFTGCSSLTAVPPLDLSSAKYVSSLFEGCSSLTTIPQLDFSNATSADKLFYDCSSLTTVPPIDTSKATKAQSMFNGCSKLTAVPPLDLSSATNVSNFFYGCSSLTTIPSIVLSSATNVSQMFYDCINLTTVPPLSTFNVNNMSSMFDGCKSLTTVEGIDFSGLTSSLYNLFGYTSSMPNLTRFIVNGKINVSISDNYSIKALTAIDYDSVKSILAAADRTDNTNAKTLAFNRTMTDQNGELAALVSSCTSKGWTISGLTIQ